MNININELEKMAMAAMPNKHGSRGLAKVMKFHDVIRPEHVLAMIELLREMADALEDVAYDEEGFIMNPDAAEVYDKYKEVMK